MDMKDLMSEGYALSQVIMGTRPPKRFPESIMGPRELTCDPCGHTWAEHDDDGCLWHLCLCILPGERK